jgi:hypothetical protein
MISLPGSLLPTVPCIYTSPYNFQEGQVVHKLTPPPHSVPRWVLRLLLLLRVWEW